MLDIVGVGGIAYDLVLTVDAFPAEDGKTIAKDSQRLPGGMISNAVCAAAALGCKAGYIGWLGNDPGGRLLVEDFIERDVDMAGLTTIDDIETPYTVILVTPSGERSIIVPPNPIHNLNLSAGQLDVARSSKVVYTYPRDEGWCRRLAGAVHPGGGWFALDVEDYIHLGADEMARIFAFTDVLFIASGVRERLGAASITDIDAAGWVIETVGAKGAYGAAPGMTEPVFIPARQVPVVDTTGAGDTFHAAVISARLRGADLTEALQFATAAASISVGYAGARGGLPTREQVEAVLNGA